MTADAFFHVMENNFVASPIAEAFCQLLSLKISNTLGERKLREHGQDPHTARAEVIFAVKSSQVACHVFPQSLWLWF